MTSLSGFECQRQQLTGDRWVLRLRGELDLYAAQVFQRECLELLDASCKELYVDLGDLQFIDSAGLASLLILYREAGKRDKARELALRSWQGVLERQEADARLAGRRKLRGLGTRCPVYESEPAVEPHSALDQQMGVMRPLVFAAVVRASWPSCRSRLLSPPLAAR